MRSASMPHVAELKGKIEANGARAYRSTPAYGGSRRVAIADRADLRRFRVIETALPPGQVLSSSPPSMLDMSAKRLRPGSISISTAASSAYASL